MGFMFVFIILLNQNKYCLVRGEKERNILILLEVQLKFYFVFEFGIDKFIPTLFPFFTHDGSTQNSPAQPVDLGSHSQLSPNI